MLRALRPALRSSKGLPIGFSSRREVTLPSFSFTFTKGLLKPVVTGATVATALEPVLRGRDCIYWKKALQPPRGGG